MSISVDRWVSRLKPTTEKMARNHLAIFLRWLHTADSEFKDCSPDQLINCQKNADNSHQYDILDLIQKHILSMRCRRNTKAARYTYLRSFFMHNRAELPRDRSFKLRGDKPTMRGDLTIEEARRVILASNPMYQALFLSMLQGGMGSHEVLYWNMYGLTQLQQDLRGSAEAVKVSLPCGRKQSENEKGFYTWLGGDALDALRKWMEKRPQDAETIFITNNSSPLTYFTLQAYWRRKLRRLSIGVEHGLSGKSPHELRDLFRSQWAKSGAKDWVGEFLMGHTIDPLDYNKAWRDERFCREEYLKALPYLQILSSGRPYHQVDEEEVEALRAEVKRLQSGDELKELREQVRILTENVDRVSAKMAFAAGKILREK